MVFLVGVQLAAACKDALAHQGEGGSLIQQAAGGYLPTPALQCHAGSRLHLLRS
jgi:hypothetical protein